MVWLILFNMKKLLFILFVFISIPAWGTKYYVKNGGNDASAGTSDGTAWATIAKVNSISFSAGDTVAFKCGDLWREELIIPSSGSGTTIADSTTFITFTSYGSGAKPKIYGSEVITTWTAHESRPNVWRGDVSVNDPHDLGSYGSSYYILSDGYTVYWRAMRPTDMPLLSELAAEGAYAWMWRNDSIYIYWEGDPNSDFTGMEVAQRDRCIYLNDKEYITIDGLECRFGGTRNIGERGAPQNALDGLIIKNCKISYSGTKGYIDDGMHNGYGISAYHSQMLIKNNEVFGNGRRQINLILQDYGDITFRDVIVENNTCYEGYHAYGISTGMSGGSYMKNIVIRNNYIYEDSTQTLIEPESEGSNAISILNNNVGDNFRVDSVFIYNNVILWNTNHAIQLYRTQNVYIVNNTIYATNENLPDYRGLIDGSNCDSITIKNNIIYGTKTRNPGDEFQPAIYFATGTSTFREIDYNLYFQLDSLSQPLLRYSAITGLGLIVYPDCSIRTNDWTAYMSGDYNADRHSIGQKDPLFVNRFGRFGGDYRLQEGSPAIGAGDPVSFATTDIRGYLRDTENPTMGAYEFGSLSVDSSATNITSFILTDQESSAIINTTNHTVVVQIRNSADITDQSPTIGLDYGATVDPASGVSQDFTSPVVYTVTALDGETTQEWTVTLTVENPPGVAEVTTDTITIYNVRYATGAGNVTSDGGGTITSRGVCWSTSANPTISDSKFTSGGTTGVFSGRLYPLKANTTYHYRAFAVNESGTSYGADQTFTTPVQSVNTTGGKYLYHNGKLVISK